MPVVRSYTGPTVPLSEREQQILRQIEQSLYEEDPHFARGVARRLQSFGRAWLARLGALAVVLGLAALIVFFFTRVLALGIVAFVAMVGGIVVLTTSIHALTARPGRRSRNRLQELPGSIARRLRHPRRR